MILFIIFTLLFNVVDAKNILTKNKPSHWCNLPTGYVEQSPVRGFNFMKLIPLSKYGKYRGMYFVQVDDEDFEWLNQWNWSVIKRAKVKQRRAEDLVKEIDAAGLVVATKQGRNTIYTLSENQNDNDETPF